MYISYPTSLDSFTKPSSTSYMDDTNLLHDVVHTNELTAIEALEAKVGINSSASVSSLDYKVTTAQGNITTLQTDLNTAEGEINTLQGQVVAIGANVSTLITRAGTLDLGWSSPGHTWTYASATTFTIVGDQTASYQAGDKVRWTQGATYKYGYIYSAVYSYPNTTVTLTTNTDYSVANSAIADNYISRAEHPYGFPDYLNFVSSWTATGSNPSYGNAVTISKYNLSGLTCTVMYQTTFGSTTSFGTGNYIWSIPVTSSAEYAGLGTFFANRVGVSMVSAILTGYGTGSVVATATNSATTFADVLQHNAPYTWANGDTMRWLYTYKI